jgi:hypothetical protein
MNTYRFNFSQNHWVAVALNDPGWADRPGGWDKPQYYSTIQTATFARCDGGVKRDVLLLLVRSGAGLQVYEWSFETPHWVLRNDELAWSDLSGWDAEKYYSTIQTLVVGERDEKQELLLFARRASGMDTYRFDPIRHVWQQFTTGDPSWSDVKTYANEKGVIVVGIDRGWRAPQCYDTIRAVACHVGNEDRVLLLGRSPNGVETHQLDFGPSSRWVGWNQGVGKP